MLKLLVPRFCSDLSVCLRDIAQKQVPAKLNSIVVCWYNVLRHRRADRALKQQCILVIDDQKSQKPNFITFKS